MVIILLNCVTLGMYQPCVDYKCLSNSRCQILQVFDGFIFAFFSLEMTVKMVAMGVWGRGTYLADPWNRLDLFIVLAGGLEYCLNVQNINLSAIRTIRVLRPLRAINRIPSMRILVMLLLDTLPMLGNVLLLCFFVFFIFGIVGVQLWQGILRQRCFISPGRNFTLPAPLEMIKEYKVITNVTDLSHYYTIPQEQDFICSKKDHSGMHLCQDIPAYRFNNTTCTLSYEQFEIANRTLGSRLTDDGRCIDWNRYYDNCVEGESNPAMGTISFDNIGLAWVAIFLVISLEGWSEIMYNVQDAHSFWDWIYFVLLIVIGSFFMINLCLVVIATQFSETKKREMERMRMERARFQSSSTLASSTNNSEPSSCYAEIVKYIAHLWRRAKRRLVKKVRLLRYHREQRRDRKIVAGETIRLNCTARKHHPCCPKLKQQQFPPNTSTYNQHQSVSRTSSVSIAAPTTASEQYYHSHNPKQHHYTQQQQQQQQQLQQQQQQQQHDFNVDLDSTIVANNATSGAAPLTTSGRRAGLLRVPSISNADIDVDATSNLLSPAAANNNSRRRSSVMFSDVVFLHGGGACPDDECNGGGNGNNGIVSGSNATMSAVNNNGAAGVAVSGNGAASAGGSTAASAVNGRNVCSSEKMTQTGDGNIWQITSRAPTAQTGATPNLASGHDFCDLISQGEAITCQELLALGAINAALPTGQIALDSFFNNLSKEINSRRSCTEDYYNNLTGGNHDEDFSCCQDLWQTDSATDYKADTRSRCYVVTCLLIKGFLKLLSCIRRWIKRLVEHRYFRRGILLAILINTLSMGVEYHDQPDYMTNAVEMSNIVFSAIFAFEMILKVIAEGPFGYISNGFNVFDGIIVCLSAVEMFKFFAGDSAHNTESSGLSVLRTFRLLRILKLVRFMPNLRRQLFVMLRTMDNVAIFFSLLILFIFIFSVLGMYLFGGKFCKYTDDLGQAHECPCEMIVKQDKRCECDRKHFNNFLWATVTVFQILTQEDWNVVLASGMAKTSHWAALYFVALMTFGNYVLFNLLVAILVEGFSSERNERREREQRELARRKMSIMIESGMRNTSSSDESNRSLSSSSASFTQETKNFWRSAEELRKTKDYNIVQQKPSNHCACNDLAIVKDCCSIYSDPIDPKCNIQKESFMLKQPRQPSPPMITTTAPTPQDSPCNTLDDFPEFQFSVTSCMSEFGSQLLDPSEITSRKNSSGSMSGLLKPPSLSSSSKTFRLLELPPAMPSSASLSIPAFSLQEAAPSSMSPLSATSYVSITDKSSSIAVPGGAGGATSTGKSSWKKPSLRRKKKCRSGSDSEAIPLNNGRDHSQCNGGGVTRHLSLRSNSLLQGSMRIRNDTQIDKPNNNCGRDFSPQNSFRGRSHTYSSVPQVAWTPQFSRHNSLTVPAPSLPPSILGGGSGSGHASPAVLSRKNSFAEPKSVNTGGPIVEEPAPVPTASVERTLPSISLADCVASASQEPSEEPPKSKLARFFRYLEPKSCMKEKDEYSLYVFSPHNGLRVFCNWFVSQKWFDNLVLFFIAMNCITLAMERPIIPANSPERMFLTCSNYLFTFVFSLEMAIKVVAWGLCYGPDAYFTSGWNIMDGALVVISIVDLLMSIISESSPRIFGILRVFRLLRSLRPLRVINRAPGLKLVVQTLLSSLRPIGNIVLICCTFFIIFGILGVQLFKGTFFYCKGDNNRNVTNKLECQLRGNEWVNQEYNFDHLGMALMSLFVLSSRDGWVNIMYTGIDAVGVDQQPQVNYSEWRLLYFISFILLVGFFVLNMFVGVVVENFHRCREEQEKEERIRRAAKRALQMEKRRKKMNEPPYYINYSQWRMFIHNVVTSKYFDLAIAAVIGLNVVTMATESYKMPDILSYILKIFNYFFTAVFILESSMKLIALGFFLYMKDKWNQLDVVIVILSVVGIILEELKSNIIPINPTVLRVMRVMRIARVLKLLKMAKGIRALLDTVMQALPQVGNLGLLFFLLFFIFAALGVELFGRLDCKEYPCQGLGEHADFSNFGMAFLTLFRVATGDNWNGIMKDTLRTPCDDQVDCVKNCCISPIIAPIFFVIFVLMAQFVLVNVVVAVLMKHLEESHKHLEDEQDMDNQLEREFQEKQEMEERRELCLAIQLDSECSRESAQMQHAHDNHSSHKPLTKVLSLPSNFIYNPPGSAAASGDGPRFRMHSRARRQTMHSQQPLNTHLLNTMDDIRDIDESTPDIYSIEETRQRPSSCIDFDEIVVINESPEPETAPELPMKCLLLTVPETREISRKPNAGGSNKLYGSTKFLFAKSVEVDEEASEETPFLRLDDNVPSINLSKTESQSHLHDIKEPFDLFELANRAEENLV